MSVPVMSAGNRSGVNWTRPKLRPRARAKLLTSSVLAKPGTPTSKAWPRGKQCNQQGLDHFVLADHGLSDLGL